MKKSVYLSLIKRSLAEDLGSGIFGKGHDVTSEAIFDRRTRAVFALLAKDDGILCGIEPFEAVFTLLDRRAKVVRYFSDGDRVKKGDVVARVSGRLIAILSGERTALNLVSHLSGVATKASLFADAAGSKPIVLDTRKTIPGLRVLQKYAVRTGGASNHRMGLFDMILIKDNHVDAAGGVANAVHKARARWGKRFKIEVETRTLDEVREALDAKADRIMLDNMDNDSMREAVLLVAGRAETEASGNMTLERLKSLGEVGVDYVSFGEFTHTVKALDFSLKEESCE
jgi:nicotinate-nucleotide pyrophosphorylase (carboxylating)